ncbi:MAG: glycosyltransferase [Propionibacteriaceae bacterium]|nr:glycosyltransferase [Propionibacteriaceae bacterium]
MTDPLVSIIVPVYNGGAQLARCLTTILAQTHAAIELLLIDDGSTDGSGAVCDQFADRDRRVRVRHQANGGIGRAQNAGLDAMTGDYVTFCDDDDLMSPRLVERLLAGLVDSRADMSQCRWANIGASQAWERYRREAASPAPPGRVVAFGQPAVKYQTIFSKASRLRRRDGEFQYFNEANWGKLYRSGLWDGLRFPEGVVAQDVYVATELYLRMDRAAARDDVLYYWLQHAASQTHSSARSRSFSYHRETLDCAFHNIAVGRAAGLFTLRSHCQLVFEQDLIAPAASSAAERDLARDYRQRCRQALAALTRRQRLQVRAAAGWRSWETLVYNQTVHRRR